MTNRLGKDVPKDIPSKEVLLFFIVQDPSIDEDDLARLFEVETEQVSEYLFLVGKVHDWLVFYNIDLKGREIKEAIVRSHLKLVPPQRLTNQFGVALSRVSQILCQEGVEYHRYPELLRLRKHITWMYSMPISSLLNEIITGELLCYGHLAVPLPGPYVSTPPNLHDYIEAVDTLNFLKAKVDSLDLREAVDHFNQAAFILLMCFRVAIFERQFQENIKWAWIRWINKLFRNSNYKTSFPAGSVYFRTIFPTVELYALYHKWYPFGYKEVPEDITLTPTALLHWYIGGGFVESQTNTVTLATPSTKRDAIQLKIALKKQFGILSRVEIRRFRYSLVFNETETALLLRVIGKAYPESLHTAKRLYPRKFSLLKRL